MQGYIKDHRKELESAIWMMPPLYHRIWQYLKYSVNHQDNTIPMRNGSFLKIRAGQHLTSVREIAKNIGWYEGVKRKEPNPKTVSKILEWLEAQSMIRIDRGKGNREYTLITLINWRFYQQQSDEGNSEETLINGKGNRVETPFNQSYQGFQEQSHVEGNRTETAREHPLDINNNDKECLKNDYAATNAREESDGVPTTDPQGDPVPSGEISQTSADAAKALLDRFIQLRGYGFNASPIDEQAAYEILDNGVPLEDALTFLKEQFDMFKPKHSRDRINSLSYCVGYILDNYERKVTSQKLAKRRIESNGYKEHHRGHDRAPEEDSITGGQTGWLRRRV